jgi:bifunctional non-homologous end joining protein LigD
MKDITKMHIIGTLTTKEVEYTVTSHLKDSNNVSKHTLPKETYSIVEIQEHNGHTYYITNQWYKEYKGEPQIIVDELVEEYTPANGMYNNGGAVKFYNKDNEHRLGRPSGSIEKELLDKVHYDSIKQDFVGSFGWKTIYDKLGDGYLYKLDDYDQDLMKSIPLKPAERIYRYINRTTAIGGMSPLIKMNIEKGLLYFPIYNEADDIIFETRGVKALWISLIEDKYVDGGGVGIKEYLVFVMEASSYAFQKQLEVVKEKNLDSAIKIAKDKTTKGVFTEVYDSNGKEKVGIDEFIGYTNPNDKENFYYSDVYTEKQKAEKSLKELLRVQKYQLERQKYEDENTWIIKYISTDDDDVASVWVIAESREDAIDQAEEDNSDIGEIISVEKGYANGGGVDRYKDIENKVKSNYSYRPGINKFKIPEGLLEKYDNFILNLKKAGESVTVRLDPTPREIVIQVEVGEILDRPLLDSIFNNLTFDRKYLSIVHYSQRGYKLKEDINGGYTERNKKFAGRNVKSIPVTKLIYSNGGGVGSDKWQIQNSAGRYYSVSMQTGNPVFNESPDLGYSYKKEEAESIKNKLLQLGYNDLQVVEYNPNWWKMEEGGYLHGSPNDFCDTGFKLGAGQGQGENLWGRGHYFTNDKDLATYYAKFIKSRDVKDKIEQRVADTLGFKTYGEIPYDYVKKGIRTKYGEHLKFDLYHQYLKEYVDNSKKNGVVYKVTLFPGKDKKEYNIIDFSGENYRDDDVRKKDKRDLKNLIDTLSKNKRTYAKAVKIFFDKKGWEFDLEKYNEKFSDTLKSMRDYYNNFDSYSASTPLLYNLGYDIKKIFTPDYFSYATDYKVIYDKIKAITEQAQTDLGNEEAYYKGILFTEFIKDAGYDALKYSFSPSIIPYKKDSEHDSGAIVVYDDENVEIDNCKVAENGMMMMANGGKIQESIDLYFQEGSSDKEYHIQLVDLQDGTYVVNFQYGRRGSSLQSGTKTTTPVPLAQAEKIYASLKREKMGKGYAPDAPTLSVIDNIYQQVQQIPLANKQVYILPQLLNPVEDAEMYINDDSFLAQEKKDYERRIIIADGKGNVMGLNKKGQQVPVPKNIANSIKNECTLDGEISDDMYYVFDILSFEKQDLKSYSATQRLEYLSAMEFGNSVEVVETAYTTGQKRDMFETLKAERREGIVFKKKSASYTPGRPNSGGNQLKFKFYKTATFIVANETKDKRSVGLELIDDNTGRRIFMGKVTIPPNYDVPAIGDLVEVRYLYAYRGGAVYQPTYLGKRNDSDLTDATMKQIIYKADEE